MRMPFVTAIFGLAFLTLTAVSPAGAADWTRDTVHGGQLTRSVTADGRIYTGHTTRIGPNGGQYSAVSQCFDRFVDRCRRAFSATGPNGKTYEGGRVIARGPHHLRSIGAVSGPRGNLVVGARRHWR
mgnify:CR=1 FL=1|jgi:hypothetical protein